MNEWTVGEYPVPSWIVENPDWSILRDGDRFYFEPKAEDGRGPASVWLLVKGEVVRWIPNVAGRGVWYFGEQRIDL